jgi:hypothetical protein
MSHVRALASLVAVTWIVVACGAGAASPPPSASSASAATPSQTADASTGTTSTPPAAPIVLEDAGVNTELAPGLYTSRLFRPTLTIELGPGWQRRNDIADRKLNLQRVADGGDLTIQSDVDFMQCGKAKVVEKPTAKSIVDAIAASKHLSTTEPAEVTVGDKPGWSIQLKGGGAAVPEASFLRSNEFGCVLSFGDVAFPKESAWAVLTPDVAAQLVFVDVDGRASMIRGRPGEGGLDATSSITLELLSKVSLG